MVDLRIDSMAAGSMDAGSMDADGMADSTADTVQQCRLGAHGYTGHGRALVCCFDGHKMGNQSGDSTSMNMYFQRIGPR